jgi:hypothetical protein
MELAIGLGILGLITSSNENNNIIHDTNIQDVKTKTTIEENKEKTFNKNEENYFDSNDKNKKMVSPVWRTNNEKWKTPFDKKLLYKINKNLPEVIKKNNNIISIEQMSDSDSDFSDDNMKYNNFVRRQEQFNKIPKTRIDMNMDSDDYDSDNSCPNTFDNQYAPMTLNKRNIPRSSNYYTEQDLMFNPNQTLRNNYVESSKFGENLDGRYGVTPDMTHNNMMPFFKSKSYGFNPEFDKKLTNNSVRNVELFTGSDQMLQFRHKQEVKSLFDPVVNKVDSVSGTPNFNDFKQSRFIPSDKRQGEKPFQPVLVSPGLNLGYFEQGNTGFHDMYRVMPKTVDQLRTADNPKVSYELPMLGGQKGSLMADIGITNKNRPDRLIENDFNNIIPNSSIEQAPQMYGKINLKNTNRTTTSQNNYINHAKGIEKSTPEYLQGLFSESFKQTLESSGPMNAGGNKISVPLNNYINLIPDETLRDIMARNGNQNISNISNSVKSYLYNSINSIPDETLRSIISEKINITGTSGNHQSGYLYNNFNAIPEETMRSIISNNTQMTGVQGNHQNGYLYNVENNIPQQTLRNLTEDNIYLKPLSNKEMGYLFNNLNAIPDPTLRDLINSVYNVGGKGFNGNHKNGQLFNYDDIPNQTLRNLTENNNNITGVGKNTQQRIFNYDDMLNQTHRNTYEETKNIMGASKPNKQMYLFNYDDIPDVTIREQTAENKNITGLSGSKKTRSRSDVSNIHLNDKKGHLRRAPTISSKNKGYTRKFTEYTFKNDDNSTTSTRNSSVKSNLGIYNPLYDV